MALVECPASNLIVNVQSLHIQHKEQLWCQEERLEIAQVILAIMDIM